MFKVHHITIFVNDLKNSLEYYKKLGFEEFKVIDNAGVMTIILKLDDILLEMKEDKEIKNEGVKIFGLSVDSVTEAKKYIEDNKLSCEEIKIKTGILGKKYFFIKDSNDLNIEIIEK